MTAPHVVHTADADPARGNGRPWWRDAVIYEVYVRSFADGNGDGVGDLAGVRARLPYLRDLGVDAMWFTPWLKISDCDGERLWFGLMRPASLVRVASLPLSSASTMNGCVPTESAIKRAVVTARASPSA